MSENQTKKTGLGEIILISGVIAGVTYLPFWALDFGWEIFIFSWIIIVIAFYVKW